MNGAAGELVKTRNTIALIASHTNIFISNSPLFEKANADFIFVGCDQNPLADQPFITRKVITHKHKNCDGKITALLNNPKILAELPDFILFDDDDPMLQLRQSALSKELIAKALPIKNSKYWNVAGSKTGQIRLFKELGIPHPETEIIESVSHQTKLTFPFLAKGDRFGGGAYIKTITNPNDYEKFLNENQPPFTLQKIILGQEYSIEAFYRDGNLLHIQFSEASFLINGNGPSAKRKFIRDIPEQVLTNIRLIGQELQFNGIVNCSLFKETSTGNYLFFEFDSRLNTWSHLAFQFGRNSSNYFSPTPEIESPSITNTPATIDAIDVNRWIKTAAAPAGKSEFKNPFKSTKYLREFAKNGGVLISSYPLATENDILKNYVFSKVFLITRTLFRKLPFAFREQFMKRGLTAKIARILKY